MLENFFRKPKAEKEKNPERVIELGTKVLQKEENSEIGPKRNGGYMLCTVLAMALAMGMTAGKAEAQVRGVGPQGHGFGGQIASEIFHQGVFEVGSVLNRTQNAKQDRIEHEYVAELATQPRGICPTELLKALDPAFSLVRATRTHQWIDRDGVRSEPLPDGIVRTTALSATA